MDIIDGFVAGHWTRMVADNGRDELNSIGSLASHTTDLERVFTAEGLCSGCSSSLAIEVEDEFRIGRCTNEGCGKIFCNVVPTIHGMRIISELVEMNDILPDLGDILP